MRGKRDKGTAEGEMGPAVLATLRRIGFTPRDCLMWLVEVVQKRFADLPPGEREDLRLALVLYVSTDPARKSGDFSAEFTTYRREAQNFPTDAEVQEILVHFEGVLRAVARRERLTAPSRRRESEYLAWNDKAERYSYGEVYSKRTWKEGVRFTLWRQLENCGHLVKECRAPRRRGKPGEVCGLLFVAKRPNQDFCSSTCRGRAGVRAVRARKREKEG